MKLKEFFKKFFIKNKFNLFYGTVISLIFCFCWSVVFISNSFSTDSKNELSSEIISACSINNTTTKSVNVNYRLTNGENEYANRNGLSKTIDYVYDISRQSTATYFYSGRVIFEGERKLFNFIDLEYNYPTILLSTVFSQHLNPNDEIVHDRFELKLMFKGSNSSFVEQFDNFCYITLNQADYLINNPSNNFNSYEDLIDQPLSVKTDKGDILSWKIANIIIEGGDNEYYQKLYGDYLLAYIYCDNFTDYSISFDYSSSLNDNIRYANTLNTVYGESDYDLQINKYNFLNKDAYLDLPNLLRNFNSSSSDSIQFIIYSIIFLWCALVILTICFQKILSINYKIFVASSTCGFLFSYFIFWISYLISSSNIIFISKIAVTINFIILLAYIACIYLLRNKNNSIQKGRVYEEFNI